MPVEEGDGEVVSDGVDVAVAELLLVGEAVTGGVAELLPESVALADRVVDDEPVPV